MLRRELRQVRITADQTTATLAVDGRDISKQVSGYQLSQVAGMAPMLVLQMSPLVKEDFEGLAHVVIGDPPAPGPAAAAFLGAIDAGELERRVLNTGTTCWTAAPTSRQGPCCSSCRSGRGVSGTAR
ncbi:hypothetical protein ABT187_45635 [Streptomyces sp. NPDC001817]|uniref:hypothetical protein n=1 Tax=Streptomyces sp. NPDC001817 TaxID=3154398 RepID=UPI00331AAC64